MQGARRRWVQPRVDRERRRANEFAPGGGKAATKPAGAGRDDRSASLVPVHVGGRRGPQASRRGLNRPLPSMTTRGCTHADRPQRSRCQSGWVTLGAGGRAIARAAVRRAGRGRVVHQRRWLPRADDGDGAGGWRAGGASSPGGCVLAGIVDRDRDRHGGPRRRRVDAGPPWRTALAARDRSPIWQLPGGIWRDRAAARGGSRRGASLVAARALPRNPPRRWPRHNACCASRARSSCC